MKKQLKTCLHCNLHQTHLAIDFLPKSQMLFIGRSCLSTFPLVFPPVLSKLSTMSFQEQSWLAESDAAISRTYNLSWQPFSSTGAFKAQTSSSSWIRVIFEGRQTWRACQEWWGEFLGESGITTDFWVDPGTDNMSGHGAAAATLSRVISAFSVRLSGKIAHFWGFRGLHIHDGFHCLILT